MDTHTPARTGLSNIPAQTSDGNAENSATATATANSSNVGEGAKTPFPSSPLSSGASITNQPSASTSPSATAGRGTSPSSSKSTKVPIIIGVVVGVIFAAIGLWLLWRCFKKRSPAAKETKQQADEKWRPTENRPSSGNGLGVYGDDYYSAAGSSPTIIHHGPTDPGAGISRTEAPNSPRSFLQPSLNDGSAPSSNASPNSYGLFPHGVLPSEMSGESSATPELSPNPEKSRINSPRLSGSICAIGDSGEGGPTTKPDDESAAGMHPNLEISHDNRRAGNHHVMSWMTYDDGGAKPTRPESQ